MKNFGRAIILLAIAAAMAMAAACIVLYGMYAAEHDRNGVLIRQVETLTKAEQQSVVMQHVNEQMEEIANEERAISDEQRAAAEEQTKKAELMRQHAEQERMNAQIAEQKAIEASKIAQRERATAEQQRMQAERSKRVTDTLSYITLARTIGTNAIRQQLAGNDETADLLAYAACLFTNRYHGDIYSPTIYQALAMTSQNKHQWKKHNGSVTDIAFSSNQADYIITCSTYGEILKHRMRNGNIHTETLIRDPQYDFRDVYIDRRRDIVYALSRTGQLMKIDQNGTKVIDAGFDNVKCMGTAGRQMVIFGERHLALLDTEQFAITKRKSLAFKIVNVYSSGDTPLLFDDQGHVHEVHSMDQLKSRRVPVSGQVTAYSESADGTVKAYGTSDGTIYLIDAQGHTTTLVAHRSRVTKLKIDGTRLYSSSYDGMLNLWLINADKIEPMTLFTTKGWIINFTFDPKLTSIWTGDQKGNLTQALISVTMMQQRLKDKLKRNLRQDEWNYYIDRNAPYEHFIGKEARP